MLNEVITVLSKINETDLDKFAKILQDSKENQIWIIGNGGSSLTAQHFTSDLENLGFKVRCLCENMARVTALTNDYGWDAVYVRQLRYMQPNDILIPISVHGGRPDWSNNLTRATIFAKGRGAKILTLIGSDGGELKTHSNFSIIVPSDETYVVEGLHVILFHLICKKIEIEGGFK